MTVDQVVKEIIAMGSEQTKKTFLNHGAKEPFYGVKVADLKKIEKRIKKDHALALALYDTGISDAMYLAGLVADGAKMSKKDLQKWAAKAPWSMISEYSVPWVASESPHGWDLGLEWIDSKRELTAMSGWNTLSCVVGMRPDSELDLDAVRGLLQRVQKTIHDSPNRVRYTMNGFVIAVGSGVLPLTKAARDAAKAIGVVEVNMGNTACKVPLATEYIAKIEKRGTIGKKRKTFKC